MAQAPKTWILTGSPENFAATRERGFRLVGMQERRRNPALDMAPGDHIVFSPTRVGRLVGGAPIAFQDRLRTVSEADAELLRDRLRAAAGVPA